jgi:L-threonylcarbamoyladenylate synthase
MAQVMKVTEKNFKEVIQLASMVLNKSGVIVFPTETAYGLGAIVSSKKAIERIKKIKGRKKNKPLPVIVSSKEMAAKYCELNKKALKLMKEFMPGPLSLVVKKKALLPDFVSKETVCFRISSNKTARALCRKTGKAIVSTSANLSGEKEVYSGKKALKVLGKKVDLVIDAGRIPKKRVSTIFDVEKEKVLRQGPVSEKRILTVLRREK